MKTLFLFIIALLVYTISVAQTGINYKAVIKDSGGNILANQTIDLQFIIYEGAALTNNVYQETQTTTTDAFGIITVNIGVGTQQGATLLDADWNEATHHLNVQIDIGAGFVDLGTTQFMTVPYAISAETAKNVTGLEAIDEGNGIGWRLIARNENNYDPIGFNAIDYSFVDDPNLGLGASGSYAFSLGHNGTASGEHSFSFGNQNYSLNDYAIAMGNNNIVSGLNSTAIGAINQASGDYTFTLGLQNEASENYAIALGTGTTASGEYAIAMGQNATASGLNATAFGRNTDAIGESAVAMGRGAEASGSFSFAFGDESEAQGNNSIAMGDDAFATSDYAVAIGRNAYASGESSFAVGYNTQASGEYSTAMGNLNEASGRAATAMGYLTVASGSYSTAMGQQTIASVSSATAMGRETIASGFSSTAMGSNTVASEQYATAMGNSSSATGQYSTAMGDNSFASGDRSTAMGRATVASGEYSTAIGFRTRAISLNSTAIGTYNIGGGSPDTWVETDRLFEIGNGVFGNNRNALTVLKNGNIGIGTPSPEERLHITDGRLRIGTETIEDTGTNRLAFNADLLPDSDNAFRLGNSTTRWTSVWAADGSINTSDRREKENITEINYGLKEIQNLKPVSFNWKKRPEVGVKLGLIAQDLQEIIPEVVMAEEVVYSEEDPSSFQKKPLDRLGVYYSDLIPVLIKAIQEQQEMIETLKTEVEKLKK